MTRYRHLRTGARLRIRPSGRFGIRPGARLTTVLAQLSVLGTLAGATLAGAAPAGAVQRASEVSPGVTYRDFDLAAAHGTAHVHLLTVDLADPHVRVDLLYPGSVAARASVSRMAASAGAVAGVNGDFFHISEAQHPGVPVTGAPVGPAVADSRSLKAAVPRAQRFGPTLPSGGSTEDVLGVGTDELARLDRLSLSGTVRSAADGSLPLRGLNQYALPEGSVGAYTADWGSASRRRAVCGTDSSRAAPCASDTYEVTVRDGRVVSTADSPGAGVVAEGTTVLVGREAGAQWLRKLSVGEQVTVEQRLVAAKAGAPYRFAVGGAVLRRDGRNLPGLDDSASTVRTALGIADGGKRLLLLALDGSAAYRSGLTVAEVAAELGRLGASDALGTDGGGSSALVARGAGGGAPVVRNHPSDGSERAVANGVGVFAVGG
ncbi:MULTISPECIES: phosphodiester glycosidase family protein [Streptomyces]|uniref:phosphodiester glycosidase family protein n=1 Tax=Streptomyces TaxID=1883 RepID=UPI0029B768D4|nr:phosphodiester glycosidase family protein [Streptomyces sp. ME02-6978.2a]MDX3358347.1 phosphodiester glycosidase family protein [Streptomyces sp. ME02-6978.2a]